MRFGTRSPGSIYEPRTMASMRAGRAGGRHRSELVSNDPLLNKKGH
jgi:hypothetical protein